MLSADVVEEILKELDKKEEKIAQSKKREEKITKKFRDSMKKLSLSL